MLLSKRLLAAAAEAAGELFDSFSMLKIELADQTKLISVKITGHTAAQAMARADALSSEFQTLLDTLRNDEIQTRNAASQGALSGYKQAVNVARQRLLDYEAETGLISMDQYGSIVGAVERLREMLRDVDAKLAHQRAGVAELERQLAVTPAQANIAMGLRADPIFQALLEQLAKDDAELRDTDRHARTEQSQGGRSAGRAGQHGGKVGRSCHGVDRAAPGCDQIARPQHP